MRIESNQVHFLSVEIVGCYGYLVRWCKLCISLVYRSCGLWSRLPKACMLFTAQVLEDLAAEHDLPKIVIEHRQIEKRLAGFVEYEQQEPVSPLLVVIWHRHLPSITRHTCFDLYGHECLPALALYQSHCAPSVNLCLEALHTICLCDTVFWEICIACCLPWVCSHMAHLQMHQSGRCGCMQRRLARDPPALIRIGGCICQTEASTGRLAMNNVNLQNVPKPTDFEVPTTQLVGSQQPDLLHRVHTANIRQAPSGITFVLLFPDFSLCACACE